MTKAVFGKVSLKQKTLKGRKKSLEGRMRPAGRTLAMPAIKSYNLFGTKTLDPLQ